MAKSPARFDRALLVLTKGGVFTAEQICKEMNYDAVYRISAVILDTKLAAGAVVRTVRDGRKVTGYELVNVDEMKAYLKDKGFESFAPTKATKASKVATVKAPKAPKVATVKAPKAPKVATVKAPAKPKATKVAKAPVAVAPVAVKEAAPVDVLDSIDTDITDFEDREFAQDFVDGKM